MSQISKVHWKILLVYNNKYIQQLSGMIILSMGIKYGLTLFENADKRFRMHD